MRRITLIRGVLLASLCGLGLSCIARDTPSITSNDPDCLIPAIKSSVAAGDRRVIPYLVADLSSDDSAVRFYAIDGLKRLTGQDFGYVFYACDADRQPAVQRWQQWLAKSK